MTAIRISQPMTDTILAAVRRESGEYVVRARVQTEVALMERGLIEFMDDYARLTVAGCWVLDYIKSGGKRRAWTMDEIAIKSEPITSAPETQQTASPHATSNFTAGSRVSETSTGRLGTVLGYWNGSVTDTSHENFGREYIGVKWDGDVKTPWGETARPFVDELRMDIQRNPDQFPAKEPERCGAMDAEDLDACGVCADCSPAPRTELPHKVLATTAIQVRYTRSRLASLTGLTRGQRAYVTELDECLRAVSDKIGQFK